MEKVANGIWKVTWGRPEAHTPVSLRHQGIQYNGLDKLISHHGPPIEEEKIQITRTARGTKIELPLLSDEQIFGFGLQLHQMNHTGRKKTIRVNSDPVADTGDSHAPVPFYVSSSGYGVFVDTCRYVTFYCGSNLEKGASEHKKLEEKAVATSEIELYGYQQSEGDRKMLIDVPFASGIDVYFFAGPDIKTAVQRYNLFSGGGCLPPLWGLGMWYRAYSAANADDVLRLAKMFRNDQMPIDVFGFEPGWQTKAYSCSFVWDETRFKNHEEMLKTLDDLGYKVNLWEHVFIHPTSPMYQTLLPYAGDFEVWEGIVPDLAKLKAREIFANYHLETFVKKGISGFKLDECDSSDFVHSNWSFPDIAEFPSGLDGEQMHNMLGTLYQETIYEPFKKIGKRTLSQVRSSGGLAASYPFVLYSDLYDHKVFIRGVVNSGFSGLLWAPEVRQAESSEDLIRRIETVVFSPLALLNCWQIPNPPWYQVNRERNVNNEFMDDYESVRDICKQLFEVRMSLIPYLYSSFAKYHFEGVPPFRALVMDYPDDQATYHIDDAYMMGESLLVAPLVTGQTERAVYLPDGVWYHFWTDERFEGGETYQIEADFGKIPVFVKEKTLLPLAKPVESIVQNTVFEVIVHVYGEGPKDFYLYEDDGHSFDYNKGQFSIIRLSIHESDNSEVNRSGKFSKELYKVVGWRKV